MMLFSNSLMRVHCAIKASRGPGPPAGPEDFAMLPSLMRFSKF